MTPRNDLLNANIIGQLNLNYRLIELGFITSKKDMNLITKNINSFTKRHAEAINGRQINAPKSKPSSKKTTWNWGGTFYPNAPKSGIRVRRSLGINGAIVESGS